MRVAACAAASAAVALALNTQHWYWLPATAAFLVKPDLGPLFSRVVSRFAGTAAGVVVFAGIVAVAPRGLWWTAVVAGVCGALVPIAVRHFATQTAAVTVMVLAFVTAGGDPGAAWNRLGDTVLACAIVLVVGHLPRPRGARSRSRAGERVEYALRATGAYVEAVLGGAPYGQRLGLRREAYRALAQARAAAELAAAELPPLGAREGQWGGLVAAMERIVDAVTACAVRLDHGARPPSAKNARELSRALSALADSVHGGAATVSVPSVPAECDTLADVAAQLERVGETVAGVRSR